MSVTQSRYWNGRKVKSEKIVTRGPNVEFGALYEATDFVCNEGYTVGNLDGNNPIGFSNHMQDWLSIPKWSNLSKEDKAKLDGVLVSSYFRNDSVKIIFFDNE